MLAKPELLVPWLKFVMKEPPFIFETKKIEKYPCEVMQNN